MNHTDKLQCERVYQGEGVTPICTVVTTVIGDKIVTASMVKIWIISGWLMDRALQNCQSKLRKLGMFISPLALQILLGAQCGRISTTVNISYTVKLRIKSTRLTVTKLQCATLLCLSHHNTSCKHP